MSFLLHFSYSRIIIQIFLFVRFEGELSADAITDWFATTVLGLPRVFYHTKETLVCIL